MTHSVEAWDEIEWERLLLLIESGAVIPVVGPELSLLYEGVNGQPPVLDLGRQLAARLRIPLEQLPPEGVLNEIACRLAARGGSAQDLYLELHQLLQKTPLLPAEPLRQLAEISDFSVYITTAFDTSIEVALREARAAEVLSLSYAPNDVQDLPGSRNSLTQPIVYHLLGRVAITPSYAVTDEDALEFFHALLSPQRRPERLFSELASSHLLIAGGGYSDWLARFFLRTVKGEHRLSDPRSVREFIVDRRAVGDESLVVFLHQFSRPTRLFADADPAGFIADLHRRWCERNPEKLRKNAGEGAGEPIIRPPDEMPDRAIFISYAREDTATAHNLFAGLQARGLNAWFDFERLEAGDTYEQKIRRSIQNCSLFIPIISRNTEDRRPRFFKREWSFALDRARDYLPDDPFIMPIAIDDTLEATARVPDRFLNAHWTRLPHGEVTVEFASQLREKMAQLGNPVGA